MADVAETLVAAGRRCGHHAWLELKLFEAVGGWVPAVPDSAAKALLAARSRHHAWHGELWLGLLPVIPTVDGLAPGDLVVPRPDDAELVATLTALPAAGADPTATALGALHDLVAPRLRATYAAHRDVTAPVADGPALRVLDLIEADVEADDRAVAALLAAR
jgi:hypothetical protein